MRRQRLVALCAVLAIAATGVIAPQLAGAEGAAGATTDSAARSGDKTPGDAARAGVPLATPTASPSLFVPITPFRMYDSRSDPDPWLPGQFADLDATTDLDDVPQIPTTATGVTFNVTAVTYGGQGFVQILAPGGARGDTSTVNWSTDGQFIANGGSVGLVNRKLQIFVGGSTDAVVDVIIDVTGYYVAPT